MRKQYILFVDSGIGGLTTLACSLKLNNSNYLYFADNKFAPYGNLTQSFLKQRLEQTIRTFLSLYSLKIVVLACNTATMSSITYLRKKFPDLIFIGTEPAIKLALDNNFLKPAVFATKQTIFRLKKQKLKNTKYIYSTTFASSLENYLTQKSIQNYFHVLKDIYKLKRQTYKNDVIVLGCTHYIFASKLITKIANKPTIDGNYGVSKRIKSQNPPISKVSLKLILSNPSKPLKQKYIKILNQILANQNLL